MNQEKTYGQLMSPRLACRYINGSGLGKRSVIGEKLFRMLLKNGTIPSFLKNGRWVVRKKDVDLFMNDLMVNGCKELNIIPYHLIEK